VFDSVPRYLQLLAWRRLGVPADVADWFVELDTNGSTFFFTSVYNTERQMSTLGEIQQGVNEECSLPVLHCLQLGGLLRGKLLTAHTMAGLVHTSLAACWLFFPTDEVPR
jgi:hypothetical protein